MTDESCLDIRAALRSARDFTRGKKQGAAPLLRWLQEADWDPLRKAAVLMHYSDILSRQGRDDVVVRLNAAAMDAEYSDPALAETIRTHALLARYAALERLGREDEAWSVLADGLAEHVRDRNPSARLPWLLSAAADILARRIGEDGAALARSLAAEAKRLPRGSGSTASLASGVGVLMYLGGANAAALEAFDFVLERSAKSSIDSDICAALAGRKDALFMLGRFRECVSACDSAIRELANVPGAKASQVRQEVLATRELAVSQLRMS